MSRTAGRFGLTPADRAALNIRPDEAPKLGGERLLN
jgi:hypothetical protein